uniref:SH3 domain-containing protein n=1 Tax=Heterorhabditis bacteriophora TaxID=37862 RepID=A0A1I7XBG2_HETBA
MDYLRIPRSNPRATTPTEGITDYSRQSTPSPASPPISNSTPTPAGGVKNPFDDEDKVVEDFSEIKVYPNLNTSTELDIVKSKKDKDLTNPFDEDTDSEEEAQVVDLGIESVTKEIRKVLYTVISTHEYKAVDTDELSFGPGEEIKVLESTTEDQIDEGWQLGEKANGIRGVFPENFTKKVV